MGITISLTGACRNAATTIRELLEHLHDRMAPDEFEHLKGGLQPEGDAFILEEIARLAEETRKGRHTTDEFLKFFDVAPGIEVDK